jgi:hypothetical protein
MLKHLDHTTGILAGLHTSLNYLHTQSYTVINTFPTYTMDQHISNYKSYLKSMLNHTHISDTKKQMKATQDL